MPGTIEIAYRDEGTGKLGRRRDVVARRWVIPPDHVTQGPDGHVATDPLRTAIDLARGQPLHLALAPIDAALRIVTDWGVDEGEAALELRRRWTDLRAGHGIRTVGSALEHGSALAESPLESMVRGRIIVARLPSPMLQVCVTGASGRRYRADLGMHVTGDDPQACRLLIEADGLAKYTQVEDLAREKARQHDLECNGHEFVRVVYVEALRSPERFLANIERIIHG
jgi:hypothetical protein